ncbi:MAG: polyribonucleotide nucleotidyltransferase [bacterium]|nr:polyribonucleotide nucleotidyltransferase [bacterium]
MIHRYETEIGGRRLLIETGKIATQANASVLCQYGETTVLATVVIGNEPRAGINYFPLMVDYEEKLYAAGKIKGSRFIKREGRATDEAVLTSRLIDRAIRPLFDESIKNDVQVVLTVLSIDGENDPDVPAMIAASTALSISDIPWGGPIGGLRIGKVGDEWTINTTYTAQEKSILDLYVAGTGEKVIMIEAGAQEVSEQTCYEAIQFAVKHLGPVCAFIKGIADEIGLPKRSMTLIEEKEEEVEEELTEDVIIKTDNWLKEHLPRYIKGVVPKETKAERKALLVQLKKELDAYLKEEQVGKDKRRKALEILEVEAEAEVSRTIIRDEWRVDGRSLTDVRPISAEVAILPRIHGSGLFSRGETQVLSIVTLGSPGDEQTLDGMEESGKKRYMHHYNFPPFCVGEAKPMRGPGRREIGHGALAEKALLPVLPSKEDFPYTIRVVSEVLGSNGSSSMGSTCGSTLALMDAGVPIKKPVAGIAMGMASNDNGEYRILTDLQDLEDGQGGMDFKIAGTADGITAIQLDTKTKGLTMEMIEKTLQQGKDARIFILKEMSKAIEAPRTDLSPYAPRIISIRINPERIRDVIGPGGKMINQIIDETGVQIDIEQDGTVLITSNNEEAAAQAVDWVKRLTKEVVVGEVFTGKVTRIMNFGAFVEIAPRQEGLVHISEIAPTRIEKVEDVLKLGQEVKVKVMEIDDMGRINLSIKRVAHTDENL